MKQRVLTLVATAALTVGVASAAFAHQLVVFASTDCDVVLVEAKFSNGRIPVTGEVRVLDGQNTLLLRTELGEDGTARVPLAELDSSTGLLIEVDAGNHDDYWILTPEDIAGKCPS